MANYSTLIQIRLSDSDLKMLDMICRAKVDTRSNIIRNAILKEYAELVREGGSNGKPKEDF